MSSYRHLEWYHTKHPLQAMERLQSEHVVQHLTSNIFTAKYRMAWSFHFNYASRKALFEYYPNIYERMRRETAGLGITGSEFEHGHLVEALQLV